MYQIDVSTAAAGLPPMDPAGAPGFFTGGDPGALIPPTEVPADFMNTMMIELLSVLAGGGVAPVKGVNNQVVQAIQNMITASVNATVASLAPSLAVTGEVKWLLASAAPIGWLVLDGKTVGSAASGATGLAHAAAQTLFTLLWSVTINAVLPIQDAAGAPSARGASAAADFAANKRMPLPDLRGVVPRGLDLGRGFGGQANLAEYLADAMQGHHHSLPGMPRNGSGSSYAGAGAGVQLASNITETGDVMDDGTHGVARVADYTRDKSVALFPVVKI